MPSLKLIDPAPKRPKTPLSLSDPSDQAKLEDLRKKLKALEDSVSILERDMKSRFIVDCIQDIKDSHEKEHWLVEATSKMITETNPHANPPANPKSDAAKFLMPVVQDAVSETSCNIDDGLFHIKNLEKQLEQVGKNIKLVLAAVDAATDE
ncbi:hypothetical protein N7466_003157 [Penicillium verhagenii]|uniref:uncharacterized protein n=1 Tax=Penicillium verhagenii TaxID=1562060 RepID=UPI0025452AFD|nr:uncharacterized protein N7466_003157 [Penicillium verhagenii]KAJ5936707.1 hypothetical protein N7466_003157 [Penicillium verhagenii]